MILSSTDALKPCSQALIKALYVITSATMPCYSIAVKTFWAGTGYLPFPSALIKALQVILLGTTPCCYIAVKIFRARPGCSPFSQALIKAS